MIREIKAVISYNPLNNQFFRVNIVVDGIGYDQYFTFKYLPTVSNDIQIGLTVEGTRVNVFNAFQVFASVKGSQYSAVQNDDGASIFIDADEVDSGNVFPWFVAGEFTVTHTTISLSIPKVVLSRSPYFIDTQASSNFDRSELELKIWTGHRTTSKPATATYTLSKPVVQAGQDNIVFDIHKLVNDRVRNELSIIQNAGVYPSELNDSVWVEARTMAFLDNVLAGTTAKTFLAIDGFGYHKEGFNPQAPKVMSSITRHVLYPGLESPLFFNTVGLEAVKVNGFTQGFSFNEDQNNQNFAYINAAAYPPVNGVNTVTLTYDVGTFTHVFTVQEGCSYEVVNCIFKNRFGFWQSFPFAKASRSGLEKTSEQYKGIVSSFGRYNISHHNNKQFNTSGKRKRTLNTDFLPENYNQLIEELELSEFVYLVSEEGGTIPVELLTKSIQFKTKRNERMIQYTMEFEESYNVINQVT